MMIWKDPFFIRNLVYGLEDSFISTTGVVVGMTFAGMSQINIIVSGIILVLVEAMSMSFGSLLSEESFMITAKSKYSKRQLFTYSLTMFISYIIAGSLVLAPYILDIPRPYIISISIAAACLFVTVWKTQHSLQRACVMTCMGLLILALTIFVGRYLEKYKEKSPKTRTYSVEPYTNNAIVTPKVVIYTYWHGRFPKLAHLCLRSFLRTQNQTTMRMKLYLENCDNIDELRREYPSIDIIDIDWNRDFLSKHTILQRFEEFSRHNDLPLRSDFFRISAMITEPHDCGYVDLDVLFQHPLDPFMKSDFLYRWDDTETCNSAIMFATANGRLKKVLPDLLQECMNPHPLCMFNDKHPSLRNVTKYSVAMFDPFWEDIRFDRVMFDGLSACESESLYTHLVSELRKFPCIHWHNRFDRDPETMSKSSYMSIVWHENENEHAPH